MSLRLHVQRSIEGVKEWEKENDARPNAWRHSQLGFRQWLEAAQRRARTSVLWEQKTTGNRQFTIKEDDWEELRKHALLDGSHTRLTHHTWGRRSAAWC